VLPGRAITMMSPSVRLETEPSSFLPSVIVSSNVSSPALTVLAHLISKAPAGAFLSVSSSLT
ncbi:MAG: hypothetical protein IJY76_03565, partial [Anaerotignum sp.]|nr:hypothetical protein [Anaerotignum sp.]